MFHLDQIGTQIEQTWVCTPRDYMLYALGVGATSASLDYIYEKNLKIIPTFATLPVTMHVDDTVYMKLISEPSGTLHAANELTLYHPLPREGGTFRYTQTVENLYDMGDKGSQLIFRTDLYDETGTLLASSRDTEYSKFDGNWNGPPRPADTFPQIPDRDPDLVITEHVPQGQPHLYRLSGDYFPLHIEPEFAAKYGFERPILHGLCSYGYICRMAIEALFPGQPERLTGMKGRFKNPSYDDVNFCLHLWKTAPGQACYRLLDADTGKIIVDRGQICWNAQ